MSAIYETITPKLKEWMEKQKMFFIATAPLSSEGHVNCSPKGGDTFQVLGEREAAYVDLTGSGIETISHVQENGRIVIMFCAFEGAPKIVRLHGKAEVIYPGHADYGNLVGLFPEHPGVRAIVRVAVSRISDSCGYAVPLLEFVGNRDALDKWANSKGPDGLAAYRKEKNRTSIDDIEGYQ